MSGVSVSKCISCLSSGLVYRWHQTFYLFIWLPSKNRTDLSASEWSNLSPPYLPLLSLSGAATLLKPGRPGQSQEYKYQDNNINTLHCVWQSVVTRGPVMWLRCDRITMKIFTLLPWTLKHSIVFVYKHHHIPLSPDLRPESESDQRNVSNKAGKSQLTGQLLVWPPSWDQISHEFPNWRSLLVYF